MASFDLPEMPETRMTSQLLLGAASPLWSYFGAAAAGGVAYWWMTRWTQAANIEALFGATAKAAVLPMAVVEAAVEPAVEAVEMAFEATEEVLEAVEAPLSEAIFEAPVGGESAPISPLVEATGPVEPEVEAVIEATPEPVVEAAPEPVVETAPEPVIEAAPEPLAETLPERMMEATAHPLPEPAAKPRARKTPPANGLEA